MRASTRRTLYWKYAAYFAGLVSVLLIVSGAIGGYFAYRQSVAALEEVQRTKAQFAATEIANFMRGVQEALRATVGKFDTAGEVDIEDLRLELVALLRHHPEISELHWIAADGEQRFELSRFGPAFAANGRNWSDDPRFRGARSASDYVGQVYFHKETEPYVSVAAARDPAGAVLAAEVNLKYVWDVISQMRLAPNAVAYVVDSGGQLISHPDIGLVLAKTNLSGLPHVRRALHQTSPEQAVVGDARDIKGLRVISTMAPIEKLGWTVFAEQSLDEALRPVLASVARSIALVLLGIVAAIAASLLLAGRMVRPIREIETRARQLGEGEFERRIDLRTGDEIEALADQFNRMAARLQEMYSLQETRIAERTHDLAVANEAQTRFLAAASHDLRQPIHALSLFVGHLRAMRLPGDAGALLEKTGRSVDALRELLEALFDLSKLEVGAVTPEPKPLPLDDLLSRLAAQFVPSAETKGLALTLVRTSLWVSSDALLLERILLNVIGNAVRYTEHGRILIGCRRRHKDVEVLVMDTGIGIDPAHLPNIFQEFYRVASADRGMGSGLGLGLAIVQRLATLLGHRIRVDSVPGKGTVFRLLLPRTQPQPRTIAPPGMLADTLHGTRVLVVDDEALVRDAVLGLLTEWGCDVVVATTGDEAVELARGRCPDVVLCDLNLAGGESGIEVVERLRRECGPGMSCAFITGESAPERLAEARAAGCPVTFKPTTPARLRAIVEHLVRGA